MKMTTKKLLSVLIGTIAITLAIGCGDTKDPNAAPPTNNNTSTIVTSTTATSVPKTTPPPSATPAPAQPDAQTGPVMPKPGEKVAVLTTNYGTIVFRFLSDKAPGHVKNFEKLANSKFYDGTKFHRVIPHFMIQGGDPNTKPGGTGPAGTGGPGYTIKAEFNDTHHARGIVSMARSQDPDSAGSQFFICVADAASLDNQYSAFGQVVKGMDVVDKIVNLPTGQEQPDMPNPGHEAIMKTVRIETWPLKG